jgi:hypothetical protein
LLKGVGLTLAMWASLFTATLAQETPDLIVGSVRDESGVALAGASVTLLDAGGREVGSDVVDARGTFAARPRGDPRSLRVRCRHCAPLLLALDGRTEFTIVLQHYDALDHLVPSGSDLAALPYGRVADALALTPFVLPSADGTSVSDRGLDGGYGLIADNGAPVYAYAGGPTGLADFPNRYATGFSLTPPSLAYRYANGGGGGRFDIDSLAPGEGAASFDGGAASSLVVQPSLAMLHPSFGVSSDAGTLTRRADLDLATPFDGGFLRAGITSASLDTPLVDDLTRSTTIAHVTYATESQNYRTSASLSASDAGFASESTNANDYRESNVNADFRLERPGAVTFAVGASAARQNVYDVRPSYEPTVNANVAAQEAVYAEATTGNSRAGANVGVALDLSGSGTTVLLPSMSGHVPLGPAYIRAGYSESSSRDPALDAAGGAIDLLERDDLPEAAVGYDAGGRISAEAIAFRQFRHGGIDDMFEGDGARLVWQVAPRFAVRLWTLRDFSPGDGSTFTETSAPGNSTTPQNAIISRQLFWSTYTNGPTGLRLDAVAHRDVTSADATFALDVSVFVPVLAHVAVAAGTVQHHTRTYYLGIRAL